MNTEKMNQQDFDSLLAKIHEIKLSERGPVSKIEAIVGLAESDGSPESQGKGMDLRLIAENSDYDTAVRLANFVILMAEGMAESGRVPSLDTLYTLVQQELRDIREERHIYEFPSFEGEYEYEEGEIDAVVHLPESLRGFRGSSMVLKIKDMDRFVDTFCSRDTYYRRAFDILAELDKRVLESLEADSFPSWELISYKLDGDAMFEFSHFEVDLREPDKSFRTLYVVYRYDTTAS